MGEFYGGGFDAIAPALSLLGFRFIVAFIRTIGCTLDTVRPQVAVFGILAHDFTSLPSHVIPAHGTAFIFPAGLSPRRDSILQ